MIHRFTMFGTNIAVDVNSGSIHVLDDISNEVLGLYKKNSDNDIIKSLSPKYSEAQVNDALREIRSLENQGLFFSEDLYQPNHATWANDTVVKAICLNISHDCNFRCKYCFASTGNFGGERTNMSLDIGKKAVDFLIQQSKEKIDVEIDFFGGEPLLNFEAVKGVIEYAREQEKKYTKKFKFTITTNAQLLDNIIIDYINKNFINVVLSLDGREYVNDAMRVKVDGSGTHKVVLENIKSLVTKRLQGKFTDYYVRGTFTKENLDFCKDVLYLADQGFKSISIEPVVAPDNCGYELTEQHLPTLFNEYEQLAKEFIARANKTNQFNFFHFNMDFDSSPCMAKRVKGCGSGYEYVAISPDGNIYPCHQFVGIPEFKMGNVEDNSDMDSINLNKEIQQLFRDSNVYTKPSCINCWAKFYCGGGCASNGFSYSKDISATYKIGCELQRKRLECAIWIKSQLHNNK